MIEYKNIIRALSGHEGERLVRDGMAHSFPVPSRDEQGNLIDNFFLFGVSFPSGKPLPPSAHIATCAETGAVVLHRTAKEAGFPTAPAAEPDPISYEAYEELVRSYETLYPVVRGFAFSNLITNTQLSQLSSFFDTQRVLFAGQMPSYRHIAPAFYSWMIRLLSSRVSFLELCCDGEIDLSRVRQYLEMAGDDPADQQRLLGMTDVEFETWQQLGDNVLRTIVEYRTDGRNFSQADVPATVELLAARSKDPNALDAIKHEDT